LAKDVIKSAAQATNNLVLVVEDHYAEAVWAMPWPVN